ncbi:MAG: hypothetical protein ACI9M9_000064 [Flavobacteriaceae bacterium]|jgi:hypothetical protein
MKYLKLILILIITLGYTSCGETQDKKESKKEVEYSTSNEEGPESKMLGIWITSSQSSQDIITSILTIEKDGSMISVNYVVSSLATLSSREFNFLGEYNKGVIKLGEERFTDIKYSENNNEIYFQGDAFRYKEAIPKKAKKESPGKLPEPTKKEKKY